MRFEPLSCFVALACLNSLIVATLCLLPSKGRDPRHASLFLAQSPMHSIAPQSLECPSLSGATEHHIHAFPQSHSAVEARLLSLSPGQQDLTLPPWKMNFCTPELVDQLLSLNPFCCVYHYCPRQEPALIQRCVHNS